VVTSDFWSAVPIVWLLVSLIRRKEKNGPNRFAAFLSQLETPTPYEFPLPRLQHNKRPPTFNDFYVSAFPLP
jgi:hypothetical protein